MRDFNYGSKQRKITASQIMLSKRLYTDFMTKIMLPSIYVLCLISSLDLIKQCQCSQSANIDATSEQPSSSEVHAQSRKLPDNVEVITSFGNLISDESLPSFIDDHKEFQYFDDSVDPVLITTPHYDTSPAFDIPSNHHAIHSLDITPPYLANVETVSYIPSEPYISGDPYAAKIPHTVHIQSVPKIPKIPKIPQKHFTPPRPPTFLKVTREPIWAPDVLNLEHQYIATFRSIRSSVMNFYNRMHNFFNYFMGFFSLEDSPLGEARNGKRKLKVKKKFKKFLLPLLIAYKLKFFALIPILIGGLVLLVGSTGMAGFFFALFAAVISLKGGH